MMKIPKKGASTARAAWLARVVVGTVFLVNVSCAISFIFQPEVYSTGFEVTGVPGRVYVQGLGILFLMWNATYPLVIYNPVRYRAMFAVILIQQTIGVVGETLLWLMMPSGHLPLRATGFRFMIFDTIGLITMAGSFWLLMRGRSKDTD
jgi:hypothetical protein